VPAFERQLAASSRKASTREQGQRIDKISDGRMAFG
jgi:hypothetical protein